MLMSSFFNLLVLLGRGGAWRSCVANFVLLLVLRQKGHAVKQFEFLADHMLDLIY